MVVAGSNKKNDTGSTWTVHAFYRNEKEFCRVSGQEKDKEYFGITGLRSFIFICLSERREILLVRGNGNGIICWMVFGQPASQEWQPPLKRMPTG